MANEPNEETGRTTLEISADVLKAMKLFCVTNDVKMRAFLTDAIRAQLAKHGVSVDGELQGLTALVLELAKVHGTDKVQEKLRELADEAALVAGGGRGV